MRLLIVMAGSLAGLASAVPVRGGCYPSSYGYSSPVYYSSSYSSPTYVKEYITKKEYVPVAVPVSYPTVAVPIYSYVNGYAAPACPTPAYPAQYPGYGYPAVAPTAPGYQMQAYPATYPGHPGYAHPGYGSPGYGYPGYPGYTGQPPVAAPASPVAGAAAPTADQIVEIVLKRLEQRFGPAPAAPATRSAPAAPAVPAAPVAPVAPSGTRSGPPAAFGAAPAAGNQTLKAAVSLLTTRCSSCHSGTATAGGGFAMFNDSKQLLALTREQRWDVYDQVYQGTMPKGGQQLSDQETEMVRLWARQKN